MMPIPRRQAGLAAAVALISEQVGDADWAAVCVTVREGDDLLHYVIERGDSAVRRWLLPAGQDDRDALNGAYAASCVEITPPDDPAGIEGGTGEMA